MRDLMRNTPGWVIWVCATAMVMMVVGMGFWLTLQGVDDTQYRGLLILLGTTLSTVLSGGAFLTASASQKQTNGNLSETVKTAVKDAHKEIDNGNG